MVIQEPTQNFTPGNNRKVIGVCLHIGQGSIESILGWLKTPSSMVSAHYAISKAGQTYQLVQEKDIAWAAGVVTEPSWKLLPVGVNPNTILISIEHEGYDTDIWTDAMKNESARMVRDICTRYNLPIDRDHVIGHYEVDKLNRPNCPAVDKSIVDEIVALANQKPISQNREATPQELTIYEKIIELLKKMIALVKG